MGNAAVIKNLLTFCTSIKLTDNSRWKQPCNSFLAEGTDLLTLNFDSVYLHQGWVGLQRFASILGRKELTAVKTAGCDTVLDKDFSWQHGTHVLQDRDMLRALRRHGQLMLICWVRDSVPSTPSAVNEKGRRTGSGMGMEELPSESTPWTFPTFHSICEFCCIKSKIFLEKSPPTQFAGPAHWCFNSSLGCQ